MHKKSLFTSIKIKLVLLVINSSCFFQYSFLYLYLSLQRALIQRQLI